MAQKYKKSYKVSEKELVSLSVYNVGYQKCEPLYQWGPGVRNHYLIHYIISGKGSYTVNHETHILSAGDIFLIYPNTEITYMADQEDPWEYAWVGFNGSDASIILKATEFSQERPFIRNLPNGEKIKDGLLRIYDVRGNEFEHAVEMTGLLYSVLSLFVKNANKEVQNTSNTYVQKAIEYINANYSYPITIQDIANYVGLSRSQLFRSFQAVLNQSPKEFLTDFRIKEACYLLEHSNLSVTAIANSVGFDNSLYFSKAFRKEKKVSPREYRNAKEH